MSIVFACLPESLKPMVKETFPEITFFTSELDATHKKRVRKPKIKVDTDVNDSVVSPLS